MAKKSFAVRDFNRNANPFVLEIERLINASDITQSALASRIGYSNPNLIAIFKRGVTRVPSDKIVPLAKALGADPAHLVRLWAESYTPDLLQAFEQVTQSTPLSVQERSWIVGLRELFGEVPMFDVKLLKAHKGRV